MSSSEPTIDVSPDTADERSDAFLYLLLAAFVFENAALAFINQNIDTLTAGTVMSVQMALTFGAVLYLAARWSRIDWRIAGWFGVFLFFAAIKIVFTGEVNFRFLYDIAIIPLFLLLGSTAKRFNGAFLVGILLVMAAGAAFEMVLPQTYAALFNPMKYYYFTRDWMATDMGPNASVYTDAGVYIGANRAGGSFFGAFHRLGSFYLEPISLGYYCLVTAIAVLNAPRWPRWLRASLYIMCLAIAIATDTRVAAFMVVAFGLLRLMSGSTLRGMRGALLIGPFILLLLLFLIYPFTAHMKGDLGLRLSITVATLSHSSVSSILLGGVNAREAYDSGIIYLIANMGLGGMLVYPLVAAGILPRRNLHPGVEVMGLFYLLITLVFSCAPLSVKTASLFGYTIASLRDREDDQTDA